MSVRGPVGAGSAFKLGVVAVKLMIDWGGFSIFTTSISGSISNIGPSLIIQQGGHVTMPLCDLKKKGLQCEVSKNQCGYDLCEMNDTEMTVK